MTSSCSNDEPRRDSAGDPADVAQHVVSCHSCGTSLDTLKTHGDALKYLANRPEQGQAVVERVLSSTAQAGRAALADLLYELAKACLIADPQAELRTRPIVQPRSPETIRPEVKRVGSRHSMHLGPGSIESCDKCLAILENVEGASDRHQLMTAQMKITDCRFSDAESVLRALLARATDESSRGYALINLSRTLIQQDRFAEAATIGEQAYMVRPHDFLAGYNLAIALAWLGDKSRFEEVAGQLRSLDCSAWMRSLVVADSELIADKLRYSPSEFVTAFGVSRN